MKISAKLTCDACGKAIQKADEATIVWEPWKSYYDHQDWLKLKPVMKVVHSEKSCSEDILKEYSHFMPLSVASGIARDELNAMVYDMELSKLNLSLILRRVFNDFNDSEFFKFSVEDYQNYHKKSVEW